MAGDMTARDMLLLHPFWFLKLPKIKNKKQVSTKGNNKQIVCAPAKKRQRWENKLEKM